MEIVILFLAVLALHVVATVYHLYWSIYEFDSLVHFLGGAGLSLFFIWFYFFSAFFNPQKRNLMKFLVVSTLGALFVGFFWETYELIWKQTMASKADYSYDLMMDLIMDFLGIVAACFYAYIREYNQKMIIKNQQ